MTVIEGVGDEVIAVMLGLLVMVLMMIAWNSTGVSDQPFVRTAVLVITRCCHRGNPNAHASSATSGTGPPQLGQGENNERTSAGNDQNSPPVSADAGSSLEPSELQTENSIPISTCNKQTIPETGESPQSSNFQTENINDSNLGTELTSNEQDGILPQADGEANPCNNTAASINEVGNGTATEQTCISSQGQRDFIRQRRLLRLFSGDGPIPAEIDRNETTSSTEANETLSDITTGESESETITDTSADSSRPLAEDEIRVRIKFLNDTQLLVQAKLNEMLGEFKRRNFSAELSSNKIVRLIFNGQLLRRDDQTVQQTGMFDNCVVHCQISQGSAPSSSQQSSAAPSLDMSNFMMPLFAVILGLVWYARLNYRQLFNATSTLALVGITVLFVVSVISVFVPHRDVGGARQL